MKVKEASFSFEKVFDKPNCCEDTLVKIDPSYIPCFVKQGVNTKHIIESMFEQAKRRNCAEILMEKSFSEFKFSQEGFFKRFLEMTDFIFKKYVDSLVLFKHYNFDNERKERLYDYVLKKIDEKQFYPFDFEYTEFVFPKNIPTLSNAFIPVYQMFEKYYTTDKAGKIFSVIVNKNKDFSDRCRGEMLGIDNGVSMKDFLPTTMSIFKKDSSIVNIDEVFFKTRVNLQSEEQLTKEIYDDFEQVKQDYKKLYRFINKSRDLYLDLDNASDVYAAERIFMNTITELCCYHLLAFQAKLDCANEYFKQSYSIILQAYNICQDTDATNRVHEAAEFAFKRSIVENPTDKYDDIVDKEYESLKFEKLLTDCCIREAMIIAEGVNVEDRLESLHEGVVESILNFLKKVKNTIALYFNKFTQWFDKYTASTKTYLEKYKDLITKNKLAGFEPVEIQDYETGIKRIKTPFDVSSLDTLISNIANDASTDAEKKPLGDGEINETTADLELFKAIIPDFTGKNKKGDDISFDDFCKDYFLGGEDAITKDPGSFNVQSMYDYCYNTGDLIEVLKSDQSKASSIIDKLTEAARKAADTIKNKEAEANKAKEANATQQQPGTDNKTPTATEVKTGSAMQNSINNNAKSVIKSSAIMPHVDSTLVLSEAIKVTQISNKAQNAANNTNVSSSLKGASSDNVNKQVQNIQGLPDKEEGPSSSDLERQIKVFNRLASAVQGYLRAKSVAAETICSDYMKLMKISVSYYISQSNKEK